LFIRRNWESAGQKLFLTERAGENSVLGIKWALAPSERYRGRRNRFNTSKDFGID
jgi:hypothetical protein